MATDTRALKFKILLESNPQVLDDLEEKFKEATAAGQSFASSVNIGLSVSLWDMAFDQIRRFPEALAAAAARGKEFAQAAESARRELANLSGGMGMVRTRMDAVLALADHPGWELPGLTQGAAALDGLSSGALSTAEELRRAGDVATGVGRDFSEMAQALGQAYEAAMSGQDLNGPLMALAQMGALSGQTKAELIALQKAGASGSEIWSRLSESLSRFDGELDKLRNTAEGAEARLNNLLSQVLGRVASAYLEETTGHARALGDALEDMDTAALEHMAAQIGQLMGVVQGGVEVMTRWNAELVLVAKVVGALGLITAARKFADLASRAWDAVRAQSEFNRALTEAARRYGISRRALLAHIRDQDRSTASTARGTQVREADTRSLASNTTALMANTRARAANAIPAAGGEAVSAGRRTARDLQRMGSPVAGRTGMEKAAAEVAAKNARNVTATTARVGRLTTAFRGLGGVLAGTMRGISAFLGGPIGIALLAAAGTKALVDWGADKIIARLDAQEKLENSIASQNGKLGEQLRAATSLEQLAEVRAATERQLLDLERQKKDASEDTRKVIELTEQGARARLKLIEEEGEQLVAINAEIKQAADEEERRNAAIAERLKHYEENKDKYAEEMAAYQWERAPDEQRLRDLGLTVSQLRKDYAAANGGQPITNLVEEGKLLRSQQANEDTLNPVEKGELGTRLQIWSQLKDAQQKYEETRDRIAATDKSASDRAFALEQIGQQLAADQARLAGNEELARVLEAQLRLARETREVMAATGEDEQRAAEIAQERLETERALTEAQEARQHRAALETLLAQYAIDQARLSGNEKQAQLWEQELKLKQMTLDYVQRTGLSEEQAEAFARRRLQTEQALRDLKEKGSRSGGKGGQDDGPAQNTNLSLAERARRGESSFVRTGAASVGMTPGWMDTAEDRVRGRNAFAPSPLSVSATVAGQLGALMPPGRPAAEPAPAAPAQPAPAGATGEKITRAAEGAAARLDVVEEKAAAAIDQLGQTYEGKLRTLTTKVQQHDAQIKDLRN